MPPALRIPVVAGISMPFYPARPTTGVALSTPDQAEAQLSSDRDAGYLCQPKANGDRVCLGVVNDGDVVVQSRHGGWYRQPVRNASAFAQLGAGTCLDGEVMPGGTFHPFECLALAGESVVSRRASERAALAKLICLDMGVAWLFEPISISTVRRLRRNLPSLEGYVRKQDGAYPFGRSAASETSAWHKSRW